MSKTPTKIVQKKEKPWNTEIQRLEKKKMFKTLSSDTKNTKFQETKICVAVYTKRKPNQNLAVISSHINTGYWGVFTNELSRKEKKNEKKYKAKNHTNMMSSRNKKTREKKKGTKKKNSLKKKKIFKSLSPETQSVKKHKCQETQSVKKHNVSSNKKKNVWRYTKKTETKYGGQYILYIKIEVFSQMSCL